MSCRLVMLSILYVRWVVIFTIQLALVKLSDMVEKAARRTLQT